MGLVLFHINSCVEPFEIIYDLTQKVIIVDGVLSDEIGDQYIILKENKANSNGKAVSIVPLEKAKVEVVVNNSERVLYSENPADPGNYLAPKNFTAKLNNKYKLEFTTANGTKFHSDIETLIKGTEIKNVYQKLEITGKPTDKTYKGVHKIYLDTQDPVNIKNYYLWDWSLYEFQEICKTCEPRERFYNRPLPGVCIKDLPAVYSSIIYDYECYGSCWEIIHSTKINIMSDEFSDGKTITARSITDVPIYHLNRGSVIEVKQQSISAEIYNYYKILLEQTQNSGGLADTPPVALVGNMHGENNEIIAGYFRVTDESKFYHWVDRSDILGTELKPIYIIGRPPNLEPFETDITRPPLAPCINSYKRTNIKPIGWKEVPN